MGRRPPATRRSLTCRMAPYSRSSTSRGSLPTLGSRSGSEQRKSRLLRPPLQTHSGARSAGGRRHLPPRAPDRPPRPPPAPHAPEPQQRGVPGADSTPDPGAGSGELTPGLPPHRVNPQLLRPHSAPGPAQVLPAALVGSALGVTRQRRAAPPVRGRVRALRLRQAVLGQPVANSPASGHSCPLGSHGAGWAKPQRPAALRPLRANSAPSGCARVCFRPACPALVILGSLRLFSAFCGAARLSPSSRSGPLSEGQALRVSAVPAPTLSEHQ